MIDDAITFRYLVAWRSPATRNDTMASLLAFRSTHICRRIGASTQMRLGVKLFSLNGFCPKPNCFSTTRSRLQLQTATSYPAHLVSFVSMCRTVFPSGWCGHAMRFMSSTLKKRRAKMNKHKLKKRRKLLRKKTK